MATDVNYSLNSFVRVSDTYSIGDNCMGPLGLFHLCEMLKVNGTLEILR